MLSQTDHFDFDDLQHAQSLTVLVYQSQL